MLGVGWTEMLVIGVIALIVIGPKELPAMMNRLGKFAASVRRMGADFQRELNKTTGLEEIKNLRTSITAPLKATTDAIRKEFNTVGPTGKVTPSGALKPADPKAESVVAEIHAAAGIKAVPTPAEAMKTAVTAATDTARPVPSTYPTVTTKVAGAPKPATPPPSTASSKVSSADDPAREPPRRRTARPKSAAASPSAVGDIPPAPKPRPAARRAGKSPGAAASGSVTSDSAAQQPAAPATPPKPGPAGQKP